MRDSHVHEFFSECHSVMLEDLNALEVSGIISFSEVTEDFMFMIVLALNDKNIVHF